MAGRFATAATMMGVFTMIAASATPASAQEPMRPDFHAGSVIPEFGAIASVETSEALPADAAFHIVFDAAEAAKPGTINRTLDSAARFINMHVEAGVPRTDIHIAIVVHGQAAFDLTDAATYGAKHDKATNANLAAIAALTGHGVQFYLCGQSAAALGIKPANLAPGVKMALSAMTAHALLQQQGYTLNPF